MTVVTGRFLLTLLMITAIPPLAGVARAEPVHDAIETIQSRMVKLYGAGGLAQLEGYGTGFLVSSEGHIVTIWSHLLDVDVVTVVLHDGRLFFGQVIGTDSHKDVAVLKIDATDLPHFNLSQTASAGPGAEVLAFSNMFKVAVGDEPVSVMHGVISARTTLSARQGRYDVSYHGPVYIVDAVTNNPGAGGGVLTTIDGRLLGMLGREVKGAGNVWLNYAMPIEELRPAIEDIIAGRFQRRDPLATETKRGLFTAQDFGLILVPDVVHRTPAYIETVIPGSPAAEADLRPDDLIVFANGELVHSVRSLRGVLDRLVPGDDLQLVLRRDNKLINVTFRVPKK